MPCKDCKKDPQGICKPCGDLLVHECFKVTGKIPSKVPEYLQTYLVTYVWCYCRAIKSLPSNPIHCLFCKQFTHSATGPAVMR